MNLQIYKKGSFEDKYHFDEINMVIKIIKNDGPAKDDLIC